MKTFCLVLALSLSSAALADGDGKASGSFATTDRTHVDFTETMIDGKFQAPQGFLLQGRKSQAMTQMVKLRSKWRSELRNSKSAVKALVK
jgi:hypothetical protein